MRNARPLVLLLIVLLSLSGCSRNTAAANGGEPTDTVLDSPPTLSVLYDETVTEALKGVYSWTWQNADGTSTSLLADSLHPLQAQEFMTPLYLLADTHPDPASLNAYLQFEAIPDQIRVCRWSGDDWGRTDAESELVEVSDDAGDPSAAPLFKISLEDGQYIYEVTAVWDQMEAYSGTASYSFYTLSGQLSSPADD